MAIELTKIPAFGFENKSWGAFGQYSAKAKAVVAKSTKPVDEAKLAKTMRTLMNVSKVLEYIPIFGMLFGVIGLLSFLKKSNREECSIHFIERNLIAASGFGFMLSIGDLIATVVRNKKAAAKDSSTSIKKGSSEAEI